MNDKSAYSTINEVLRHIRIYNDLKQKELAQRLDISQSYLSEIESEKKNPTIELLFKYSNEFNIPPSEILFFVENLEDARTSSFEEHKKRSLEFIDPTKLQLPEPFWRPIEQFIPKSNFIECDLWLEASVAKKRKQFRSPCCHYVYGEWHTYLGNPLSNAVRIIAFAEIPPCEVKP